MGCIGDDRVLVVMSIVLYARIDGAGNDRYTTLPMSATGSRYFR